MKIKYRSRYLPSIVNYRLYIEDVFSDRYDKNVAGTKKNDCFLDGVLVIDIKVTGNLDTETLILDNVEEYTLSECKRQGKKLMACQKYEVLPNIVHEAKQHDEPKLDCCLYGKAYIKAEFLFIANDYDNPNAFKDIKPCWTIRGAIMDDIYRGQHGVNRDINACPKCGTTLPDFELKDNIDFEEFASMDNGGEWCDKCNDRSIACTCIRPIKMWRIKKNK